MSDYKTIDPISKEKAKETMDKAVIFVGAVKEYLDNLKKNVTIQHTSICCHKLRPFALKKQS